MFFDPLMLLLGVILTAEAFVFVSAEFSLVALDQAIVKKHAVQRDPRAKAVPTATRTLSTQLSGAQTGITLTVILLGYTAQSTLADLPSKGLVSTGFVYILTSGTAVITAAIVINVFSMFFSELVPRDLVLTHPLKVTKLVVILRAPFISVVKPLILVLSGTANGILRLMGIEPQEEISSTHLASELEAMLRYSAQEGTTDTPTASLLMNTIRISDLAAVDVMTDRGCMRILESAATVADAMALSHESDRSRLPATDDDLDGTIGLVSLRRVVAVPFERRVEVPVVPSLLSAETPSVPGAVLIGPLTAQLCDEDLQMAVVVDGYGGVSGVVALENVIEGVVGEMSDEHDGRRGKIHTRSDG